MFRLTIEFFRWAYRELIMDAVHDSSDQTTIIMIAQWSYDALLKSNLQFKKMAAHS